MQIVPNQPNARGNSRYLYDQSEIIMIKTAKNSLLSYGGGVESRSGWAINELLIHQYMAFSACTCVCVLHFLCCIQPSVGTTPQCADVEKYLSSVSYLILSVEL